MLPGRGSFRQISAAPGGTASTSRPRTLEIRLDPGTTKNDDGRVIPLYRHMVEWLKIEKEIRDQNYPTAPACSGAATSASRIFARAGRRPARRRGCRI